MIAKLKSIQIIRLLKRGDDYVLKVFRQGGTVFNDGDEIGICSEKVVNNLKSTNKIKWIGNCTVFPDDKYFVLNADY
jgi:hypothetical protein